MERGGLHRVLRVNNSRLDFTTRADQSVELTTRERSLTKRLMAGRTVHRVNIIEQAHGAAGHQPLHHLCAHVELSGTSCSQRAHPSYLYSNMAMLN
jgi:hypothetical protein